MDLLGKLFYCDPAFMSPQLAAENKLILKNYWSCGKVFTSAYKVTKIITFLNIIAACGRSTAHHAVKVRRLVMRALKACIWATGIDKQKRKISSPWRVCV